MQPNSPNPNPLSRRGAIKLGAVALTGSALSPATLGVVGANPEPIPGRLAGRVALITGAARGIGRATAARLAAEGADIALLDIAEPEPFADMEGYSLATRTDLAEAASAVRELGVRAVEIVADVRDADAVRAGFARAGNELGGVDIVVANAGLVIWSTIAASTETAWRDVVDVNINGVFNTLQAGLPYLRASGSGRFVGMTSVGGRMGVVGNGAYATTKWGVIGLVKSAALEFGPEGITVNAVAPTGTNTPMYRSEGQRSSTGAASRGEQDEQQGQFHALPVDAAEPEDIAAAVAFLVGPDARYVSGLVLDVAAGGNARYTA